MIANISRRLVERARPHIPLRSFSSTTTEMDKVDTTDRLARLRELMKQHKVDLYSTLHTHFPYTER